MENQEIIRQGFEELLHDDLVIYAVLKKLDITKAHANYDDFVSEARLLYLKAYATNQLTGKQRFNYFFTKIYWGLLDLLRREARNAQRVAPESADELLIVDNRIDLEEQVESTELLTAIRTLCTEKEWFYVEQRLQGKTIQEIAMQIGVHPNALYRRKQRLKKKVDHFLKKVDQEV